MATNRSNFLKFIGRGSRGVKRSNPERAESFRVPVNDGGGLEDWTVISFLRDALGENKSRIDKEMSSIDIDRSWRRGNE